jgi:branched-chain amino acid transport system ATP-binding protein
VAEGELVALLGANGAGKSTTLMAISGIARSRSGRILFDGVDISRLDPRKIVEMGIIHCPEGRRIFPGLSVAENLRMGGTRLRDGNSRRDGKSRRFAMEGIFSLFPILAQRRRQQGGTLSGGEQQMLALGRALMAEPRLLLLDEPSLGLAPLAADEIFGVIGKLRERGVSILLVEQNARRALALADRSYLLETGSLVLSGTRAELAGHPDIEEVYLSRVGGGGRP